MKVNEIIDLSDERDDVFNLLSDIVFDIDKDGKNWDYYVNNPNILSRNLKLVLDYLVHEDCIYSMLHEMEVGVKDEKC